MSKYRIIGAMCMCYAGTVFAANVPLDCKTPDGGAPYRAETANDGTMNRYVRVTFSVKPTKAQATKIVQGCVRAAAAKDGSVDALGAAWLDGQPVELSKGSYFAYLAANKKFQFMM